MTGDVGEVSWRVVAAPLTLGMSEIVLKGEYQNRLDREARQRWYNNLSPEQRAYEDRRQAAIMQSLGMALIGSGPIVRMPAPVPPVSRPMTSCYGNEVGSSIYVSCY